jgi:hypothetical protein
VTEEERAVYEITLRGSPPASLTAKFPAITLQRAPTVTILSRRVTDSAELDRFIERLRCLGITPLEVHASAGNYEFRIEGQLGDTALHYLEWPARIDQERMVMRVIATPADLQLILTELANSGIGIDHFMRHHAA